MKTLFSTVAIVACIALSVSCGTANASTSSSVEEQAARSFDPMAAYPQAKKLASAITPNVTAISLTATRNARASASSTASSSFTWVWTVVGEDGVFVDVAVSPAGAKVLNHESRMLLANQATFEPGKVAVTGADVLALAMAQKPGQPTDLYLAATSNTAGASALRWSVGFAAGEVGIDGDSGDLLQ